MEVSDVSTGIGTGTGTASSLYSDSPPDPASPGESLAHLPSSSEASLDIPSANTRTNILWNFYESKDEADDEDDQLEEEGDESDVQEDVRTRMPGERYTEFDFNFLEEDWLLNIDESSESSEGTDSTNV